MKPPTASSHPTSLRNLFLSFTALSLQGFGGVMAVVQHELVERKQWMNREEFLEDWTVAQTLPGPNVINLSLMIGSRHFGLPGALAALAGMLAAPLAIVLILAVLYTRFADYPAVAGAVRGMTAVAAGLVLASGLRLASTLRHNVLGRVSTYGMALAGFVAVAWWRLPLPWVLLGLGGLGCLIAAVRLKQRAT